MRSPASNCRAARISIVATSEIPRAGFDTAVGWNTDVARLSGELHLPPGWRLLWTHGVDRAPTAWITSWTLWDIFLVVISVVLALRLLGRAAAAIFAVTLVLVYQEPEAPTFIWIVLLLLLAALRLGRGRLGQFMRLSYFVVLAVTVLGVLTFAIDNFRMAIYPQLESHYEVPTGQSLGRAIGRALPACRTRGHTFRAFRSRRSRRDRGACRTNPRQNNTNRTPRCRPVPAFRRGSGTTKR